MPDDDVVLPRDDDEYSPAHGEDDVGTGVDDDSAYTEEDVAASDAERNAIAEAFEKADVQKDPADDEKTTS